MVSFYEAPLRCGASQVKYAFSVAKIRRNKGGNMAIIRRKLAGVRQLYGENMVVNHPSASACHQVNGQAGCSPAHDGNELNPIRLCPDLGTTQRLCMD